MFRAISILLGMVSLALIFFGLSMMDGGAEPLGRLRVGMAVAGVLGVGAAVLGLRRGPATVPPWADGLPSPKDTPRDPEVPRNRTGVRWVVFSGAVLDVLGLVAPLLVLPSAAVVAAGFAYYTTVVVALLLLGYFAWNLRSA